MSYALQHTPEFEETVRGWGLSRDQVAELNFRLHEDLTENPAAKLHPVRNNPDYMEYSFESSIVKENCISIYAFRVQYSRDRSSLVILEGQRVVGEAE
jgi:hypothetical protein